MEEIPAEDVEKLKLIVKDELHRKQEYIRMRMTEFASELSDEICKGIAFRLRFEEGLPYELGLQVDFPAPQIQSMDIKKMK